MRLNTLKDLYIEELRDLYSAETQILEALPKMIEAASHDALAKAFREHLEVTRRQRERLEKIFDNLDEKPTGKTCQAMKGLVKESEEMIGERANDDVRDAALISSAQRIEHYEIAGYGTVATYAEILERREDHDLLGQTLEEEKETDGTLSRLAKQVVNLDAAAV